MVEAAAWAEGEAEESGSRSGEDKALSCGKEIRWWHTRSTLQDQHTRHVERSPRKTMKATNDSAEDEDEEDTDPTSASWARKKGFTGFRTGFV